MAFNLCTVFVSVLFALLWLFTLGQGQQTFLLTLSLIANTFNKFTCLGAFSREKSSYNGKYSIYSYLEKTRLAQTYLPASLCKRVCPFALGKQRYAHSRLHCTLSLV
jgi:hypothetical protein